MEVQKKDKILQKLAQDLVSKAKEEDSLLDSRRSIVNHIENNNNVGASDRTIHRFFEKFIDGTYQKDISTNSINEICKYLGYENFTEYCSKLDLEFKNEEPKREEEKGKESADEKEEITYKEHSVIEVERGRDNGFIKKIKTPVLTLGVASLMGGTGYFLSGNSTGCMYWKNDHYEKINCEEILAPEFELLPIDEYRLKYFKKITQTDTISIEEIDRVWYDKDKNQLYYFTMDGKNPINGKDLKPLSIYIYNKYLRADKRIKEVDF